MNKTKWLNVVKRSATLMVVMCCLCAPAAGGWFTKDEPKVPEQSEEYKKGKALSDERKFEEARPFFEAGIEKGDPWCMNALGTFYINGQGGLGKDEARALELISKAAELNGPIALLNLGQFYLAGMYGLSKDTKKGMELITKAAELNNAVASYLLGDFYLKGRFGLPLDKKKGIEFTTKAAEMNQPDALYNLGAYYLDGKYDLPKDIVKGLEFIKKAAEMNQLDALYKVGAYYFAGEYGFPKDNEKGIELITKAAEMNHPASLSRLGEYYLRGMYGLPEDTKKGIALMTKAADLNDPGALCWLGNYYLMGQKGVPQDTKKGIELIKKAAERNYPLAIVDLASYYEKGEYVEKNFKTALYYYKKAKELGFPGHYDDVISELERAPDLILEPKQLIDAYKENEIAADKNYKGKTAELSGCVDKIGRDPDGKVCVSLATPLARTLIQQNLMCYFDKAHEDEVLSLKAGDLIVVWGKIKGKVTFTVGQAQIWTVAAENCSVVSKM